MRGFIYVVFKARQQRWMPNIHTSVATKGLLAIVSYKRWLSFLLNILIENNLFGAKIIVQKWFILEGLLYISSDRSYERHMSAERSIYIYA